MTTSHKHLWPRHVLMTADTIGGVWTFAMELSSSLLEQGIRVSLATAGRALSRDQREQAKAAGDLEILESSFRLEWQDAPWADVDRAGEWILDVSERLGPDIVHLNDYSNAALDWPCPVLVTGHSCVLSWFSAVRKHAAPPEWDEYRRRVSVGLRAADIVTAPSRAMLNCLERHYGHLVRTAVIPNGVRTVPGAVSVKEPFIFAAGRIWDEAKNISTLAEVARNIPWPVYVAGETDGVSLSAVRSLGRLVPSEVSHWMTRASIYCLPVKYEPFGLSILEAALSGCALIVGNIDSQREIWEDAALFVAPEDSAALERALLQLIENPTARATLAEKSRRRALQFTSERMTAGYLDAYSGALRMGTRRLETTGALS